MEQFLNFSYKARYYQLGELNDQTERVIFALHGYGQLAKYFIRKFQVLTTQRMCIIAPEGLNRFYLKGFDGRVGATWMTREDRETDIENYINYLHSIYSRLRLDEKNTSILGFSQGAATASRWVTTKNVTFDSLILWAGIFPPDMNIKESAEVLQDKKVIYVYGSADNFITDKRLSEMKEISQNLKVDPQVYTFKGEHEINEDLLTEIFINNS